MTKHTILFLAANPAGTDRLALDQEARAIQIELERSGHRDQFELVTRWAVQPLDLLRELRKVRPTIVHFSGHGGTIDVDPGVDPGAGPRRTAGHRDVVVRPRPGRAPAASQAQYGLYFQGADGQPQVVTTAALRDTFGAAGSSVKLVVLSACYSQPQSSALLAHVDCIVGMSGSIRDDAARSFAIGFYGGLGERESVADAFRQGQAAISLEDLRGSDQLHLDVRDGIDADLLIFADELRTSVTAANASAHPSNGGRQGAVRPGAGATSPAGAAPHAVRDQLLTRLKGLLESQFEEVLFRIAIPVGYLPGSSVPQAMRAMSAIRYMEHQNKLVQLARIIDDVAGSG